MKNKTLIFTLILVILALAAALACVLFSRGISSETDSISVNIPKKEIQEGADGDLDDSVQEKDPEAAPAEEAANVYANTEYGFQIDIPEGYEDYKVMIENYQANEGVTYIHILFKTEDPAYQSLERNFVTGEEYPGYSSIFAFSAWSKKTYDGKVKECEVNPLPDCPHNVLGENPNYVFDVSLGNGIPPKDLEDLREMLNTSKIGEVINFKILN